MIQRRTVAYFHDRKDAVKALKRFGAGHEVRQHPKWKTWDVVKVIRTKTSTRKRAGFMTPTLKFRF